MSLIVIEGSGEGCGKSTQARMLVEKLQSHGLKADLQRFPDRTSPTGKIIDAYLKGDCFLADEHVNTVDSYGSTISAAFRPEDHADALMFQALQLANRAEISTRMMKQACEGILVTDRYWMSGYAYGIADGLDGQYLKTLHDRLPKPDLAILVDCPVEVSKSRLLGRGSKLETYEARGPEFHQKLRSDYLQLWDDEIRAQTPVSKTKWELVSSDQTAEGCHRNIMSIVKEHGLDKEVVF